MISFNWDLILLNLRELADEPYQRKLWTGQIPGKQSDFIEVYEQLFGDSNLSEILETDNKLFDQAIIERFRKLDKLMGEIDTSRPESVVLDDPKMVPVRLEARAILDALKN